MKLIVGLGNPGRDYIDSRHNIGFQVVKALAKEYRISFKNESGYFALSGKGKIEGKDTRLTLPLTFMNSSGGPVKSLLKKYKITLSNLLVVCDDLDLEFGRIKIRASGSSAGHRGLQSIMDSLETQGFPRLRIGIGRPISKYTEAREFVLSPFNKSQRQELKEIISCAIDCCKIWVRDGIGASMNIFNRASKKPFRP